MNKVYHRIIRLQAFLQKRGLTLRGRTPKRKPPLRGAAEEMLDGVVAVFVEVVVFVVVVPVGIEIVFKIVFVVVA